VSIKNYFRRILFFTSFIPELSPIRVDADMQLLVPILFCIYYLFFPNRIRWQKNLLPLLILSVASFLFHPWSPDSFAYLENILLPFLPLLYLGVFNKLKIDFFYSTIKSVIIVYFLVSIFQVTFPSLYITIFKNLLFEIRWEGIGSDRGINVLNVEPSHTSLILIVLLVVMSKSAMSFHLAYYAMILVVQMLCGSAFSLFAFLLIFLQVMKMYKTQILIPAIAIFMLVFPLFASNRLSDLLEVAKTSPIAVITDVSFVLRYNGILMGIVSSFYYLMGTWDFFFSHQLVSFYYSLLDWDIYSPGNSSLIMEYSTRDTSGLGPLMARIGIISFFMFALFFRGLLRNSFLFAIVFLLFITTFSFGAAPIWIAFGILSNQNEFI